MSLLIAVLQKNQIKSCCVTIAGTTDSQIKEFNLIFKHDKEMVSEIEKIFDIKLFLNTGKILTAPSHPKLVQASVTEAKMNGSNFIKLNDYETVKYFKSSGQPISSSSNCEQEIEKVNSFQLKTRNPANNLNNLLPVSRIVKHCQRGKNKPINVDIRMAREYFKFLGEDLKKFDSEFLSEISQNLVETEHLLKNVGPEVKQNVAYNLPDKIYCYSESELEI